MSRQTEAEPAPDDDSKTLTPVVFSTDGVEPPHQLDLWRSTYEAFNHIKVPDDVAAAGGFAAHNEVWPLGRMALLRNAGPPLAFDRTAHHIRRDSVDHFVIRLLLKGRSRFRSGETRFELRPSVPAIFSLGEPFWYDRTAADWVSLYIPRDAFPDLSAGLERLVPGSVDSTGARLLADHVLALKQRLPAMTRSQIPALEQATRSMIVACLPAGLQPGIAAPQDIATAQLERVRAVIRQNIASPSLGPRKICRLANISRSQLYRLFERHGGVAHYIQKMRLHMVHTLLTEPAAVHPSIAAIAERFGFYDPSAFSRVFRREFGYTPREARAAALSGLPPEPATATGMDSLTETLATDDFAAVMRHLGVLTRTAAHSSASGGTEGSARAA